MSCRHSNYIYLHDHETSKKIETKQFLCALSGGVRVSFVTSLLEY